MIDGMSSLAQVKAEATGCCRRRAAMRSRCALGLPQPRPSSLQITADRMQFVRIINN